MADSAKEGEGRDVGKACLGRGHGVAHTLTYGKHEWRMMYGQHPADVDKASPNAAIAGGTRDRAIHWPHTQPQGMGLSGLFEQVVDAPRAPLRIAVHNM